MGKKAFDKIATGLRHAIADAKGKPGHVTKTTKIRQTAAQRKTPDR